MLHEFITDHREEIIRRCKAKVAARSSPEVTTAELDHGVPMFLTLLTSELKHGPSNTEAIGRSAVDHGHDLYLHGFTVGQVVHDYGDICQAVTDLAVELAAPIDADEFRTLNRCLDDAIAGAVTEYGRGRDESIDGEASGHSERVGSLARELRTAIHAAAVALGAIKSGRVGFAGGTGVVLDRSVFKAHDLVDRLIEVNAAGRPGEPTMKRPVAESARDPTLTLDELASGSAQARAMREN
jgi:hypothetical protein